MTTTAKPDLTEKDLAALQLALDLTLADDPPDPGRLEQVRWKLKHDGWRETAEFCVYHQQMARLDIFVGASPPCWIETHAEADTILQKGPILALDGSGKDISDFKSARLFRSMMKADVSKYHPNPLAAIAEAKQAKRRKK